MKIRILLVDDHQIVREGLRALLQTDPNIDVVGQAETGRQALTLAEQLEPDVIVMDIAMPNLNGIETTRQIVKNRSGQKVLILSSYSDDEYVRRAVEAGAAGFIVKQSAAEELVSAIQEIRKGNSYFSPCVANRLREQSRRAFEKGDKTDSNFKREPHLTSRETEVLQLIAEGFANKQIAGQLGISIKTVEKHRQQAMNKLNLHDIASLTRYAIERGITELQVSSLAN